MAVVFKDNEINITLKAVEPEIELCNLQRSLIQVMQLACLNEDCSIEPKELYDTLQILEAMLPDEAQTEALYKELITYRALNIDLKTGKIHK